MVSKKAKGTVETPDSKDVTEVSTSPSARYLEFMTPFAETCGKSLDEVTVALVGAGWINGPDDGALDILADEESAPIADVAGDLTSLGVKKGPARAAINAFRKSISTVVVPKSLAEPETFAGTVGAMSFDAVLPPVPTDESWLEALRAGGVQKVEQSTVISAIRAALASRAGLFEIPGKLTTLMEEFADRSEEQVDPEFFKIRKQMARRSYADIFEAIEGLDGTYVTEARKKQLLGRIDDYLWPAITEFYAQLKLWQESWIQGAANPAMMTNVLLMMGSAGGMGMLPPGMMQPPDTGVLRDSADAVANAINKVFAGTGVQIAAALAYDASKIKETLTNPRLPVLTGVANRDQMLRQLNVAVSATYPRMETNLTRFVLSVMQAKDQPAGSEELQYFGMLFMLGSQIPWDQLTRTSASKADGQLSGIGSSSRSRFV